ncbi:hypothetical protein [Pseudoalteromonas sp. R3]|uniref:hypothetical protein n=1 Tax=Pseudoalteromonas sp. R3 TaxID=1709477 RepID=UPI0006B55830|nr:hypothetical protein [Pseudoalteromonas sp. R3]AZZ98743.1 hypothetical protein ELR70_17555 [Pseudoalteromonas sp. R3]
MNNRPLQEMPDSHRNQLFNLIDEAADKFENEHGRLNKCSNFDLYGKFLEKAVIDFNSTEGTNYDPGQALGLWAEDINEKLEEYDDDMDSMNEAMENWQNLTG